MNSRSIYNQWNAMGNNRFHVLTMAQPNSTLETGKMGIVQRHLDALMPKQLSDSIQIGAFHHQSARKCVP